MTAAASQDAAHVRRRSFVHLALVLMVSAAVLLSLTPQLLTNGGLLGRLVLAIRVPLLLVLATWSLRIQGLSWTDVGLKWPGWRRFLVAVPLGYLLVLALAVPIRLILQAQGAGGDYEMFRALEGNLPLFLGWGLPMAIFSAAIGEEMLFRGYVMHMLGRCFTASGRSAQVAAITGQAILFGALHLYQGLGGVLLATASGLAFGFTFLIAKRSLASGMVVHGIIDVVSLTAFYLGAVK